MRFALIVSLFTASVLAMPFGCSESEHEDPPQTTPEIPEGCFDLKSCCEQLDESAAQSCLDALIAHANHANAESWCHGILGSYQSAGLCPGGQGGSASGGASGSGGKDAGPDSSAGSGGKGGSSGAGGGKGGSSGAGGASGSGGVAGQGGSSGTGGLSGDGGAAGTGGGVGGQGPCPHDECTVGVALDSTCTSCVTKVCTEDPFCCASKWNTYCIDSAKVHCDLCGGAAGSSGSCVHSECITGVALDSLCSWCVATVCDADPYCCSTKWNSYCVDEAIGYCNLCN